MKDSWPNKQFIGMIVGAIFMATAGNAVATAGHTSAPSFYLNRWYNEFSFGSMLMWHSMHRYYIIDDATYAEEFEAKDKDRWIHHRGFGSYLGWTRAHVSASGFVIGGNVSTLIIRGMEATSDDNDFWSPDNPGGTGAILLGPIIGWYPVYNSGWHVRLIPAVGFSGLSLNGPTGQFRFATGYDWSAGTSGTIGLSLESAILWTESKKKVPYPDAHFESYHLPVALFICVNLKGFSE